MNIKPLTVALATGFLVAAPSLVLAQGAMVNAYVPLPNGGAVSSAADLPHVYRPADGYAAYGAASAPARYYGERITPTFPVQPVHAPFQGR